MDIFENKLQSLREEFSNHLKTEYGIESMTLDNSHDDIEITSINGFMKKDLLGETQFSEELPEGLVESLSEKTGKTPEDISKYLFQLECCSNLLWLFAKPLN